MLRDQNNINSELKTGDVEVVASELKILSSSQTPPFAIDNDVSVNDNIKYKYIDIWICAGRFCRRFLR